MQNLIDDFITQVKKQKLELPVSLLIELNLPLCTFFSNGIYFLEPILLIFYPKTKIKELAMLFEDKNVLRSILTELKG